MQPTTIAIDGGLFEHYTAYRGFLREYLDQLLGPEVSQLLNDSLVACLCWQVWLHMVSAVTGPLVIDTL